MSKDKKAEPKKVGRPKGGGKFAETMPQIKSAIVDWIANGGTLRDFCRQEGSPTWASVYDWMEQDKEFAARFARARDIGADAIAQQALAIMEEEPERDQHGRRDPGYIQWQKARVETRLKLLAKWNPKKYGDRIEVAGDQDNPLTLKTIERIVVKHE
jgi:hypothetical protein